MSKVFFYLEKNINLSSKLRIILLDKKAVSKPVGTASITKYGNITASAGSASVIAARTCPTMCMVDPKTEIP